MNLVLYQALKIYSHAGNFSIGQKLPITLA